MSDSGFDNITPRRQTGSYKWDEYQSDSPDTIEMWVADMDFPTAPCVIEALRRRVDHGIFGYTFVPDEYYEALISWFDRRHGYRIRRENVIYTSGVVPALSAVIKALTDPGDGVIVHTPAYNCFFSSIKNNGCRVVASPLKRIGLTPTEFTYQMDFDDIERLASDPSNKLLLLCNPHNPSGRLWSCDELERLAEICHRHGVRVVSDEIHCELTMPGTGYTPYALVDPDAVVCSSPSKAFNTAGLQIANIVAPDSRVRALVDKAININEVCDVNPFGVTALMAAYNEGEQWLNALRDYLAGNYACLKDFFSRQLPEYPVARLEATYLVWVDIAAAGIDGDRLEQYLAENFKVRINGGNIYGDPRYMRINIACPRKQMSEGLERIARGLQSLR